ncbi:MAG: tetraacyldisaccharide 4'-kinase [Caulobacteraceae bacterium]
MRLRTPRWWYRRNRKSMTITRALLTPFARVWTARTARRVARTWSFDPGIPVICVGNLTVGGSGKTPVVQAIADLARAYGRAPHVLARGYGGKLHGPLRVDPSRHRAEDVGDEALMLAADTPVWISRRRAAGAAAAVTADAGILVLDDGHQDPTLRKTVSIVVVDGETRLGEWPFGDGAVFPAGPMREPLEDGLARADIVLIVLPVGLELCDPELLRLFDGRALHIGRLAASRPPPQGPQVGFAAVAKPWRMEQALETVGCHLVDFAPFADHQRISRSSLRFLEARADALGAGLVTSEKDWVRLPVEWRSKVVAWPVRVSFDDPDGMARALGIAPRRPL